MKIATIAAGALLALTVSCKMDNPLLTESTLPYGAPQFDKIRNEHYLPAFEQGIKEAREFAWKNPGHAAEAIVDYLVDLQLRVGEPEEVRR